MDAPEVLYSDNEILAVNKRPGDLTQADRAGNSSLVTSLRKLNGGGNLYPVHRLDRPASGVVLLARTAAAAGRLSALFRDRDVAKTYWAVVDRPPEGVAAIGATGTLRHRISTDRRRNKSTALPAGPGADLPAGQSADLPAHPGAHPPDVAGAGSPAGAPVDPSADPRVDTSGDAAADRPNSPRPDSDERRKRGGDRAKDAELGYRIVGRSDRYWFLEIRMKGGRQHQIRAQLGAAGSHIKGDVKYGAKRTNPAGGIHLHARSVELPPPSAMGSDSQTIRVVADPPDDPLWRLFPR